LIRICRCVVAVGTVKLAANILGDPAAAPQRPVRRRSRNANGAGAGVDAPASTPPTSAHQARSNAFVVVAKVHRNG
jgi:hypothetical protein